MIFLWKVRYLDSQDKKFKDRDLVLDTDKLDPATRASVELCYEVHDSHASTKMLKYRHLFSEYHSVKRVLDELDNSEDFTIFSLPDYFEDENGEMLSDKQMAFILTGSPTAVMIPPGYKQHSIDYFLADRKPIDINKIQISSDTLNLLGIFYRDIRELLSSSFCKEDNPKLCKRGKNAPVLEFSVTEEEVCSFVTVFRRLYMAKEPANFVKIATVFSKILVEYPLGKWIKATAVEYEADLKNKPDMRPLFPVNDVAFTRKRLIDVFLYTQYVHQPDARRCSQYAACLADVSGERVILKWLFLTEMHRCFLHMLSAGRVISDFFECYCRLHGVSSDVLGLVSRADGDVKIVEKKHVRQQRLLEAKATELATELWERNGRPDGGIGQYFDEAYSKLSGEIDNQ